MKKIGSKLLTHLALVLFSIFFIAPFVILVLTSLKTQAECFVYPMQWFPKVPQWTNYVRVFDTIPFALYFKNTLLLTVLNIVGVVLSCPIVAYSMARLNWRGKEVIFIITLAVMMIPSNLSMIPIFIVYSKLHLVGTYAPLVLGSFFGVPFYIFLLRQFFRGLPRDLEDSARIDGCSEFGIYYKIFLPLCKPAVLTIAIFQMLGTWNDFQGPLIYLQNSEMYTLQIGLQQFKTAHDTDWTSMMAASALVALPIIILFFFAQSYFMEGITFTGIKD